MANRVVLVLGGNGLVGSKVIKNLSEDVSTDKVISLTRALKENRKHKKVASEVHPNYLEPNLIKNIIEKYKVTDIVDCVGVMKSKNNEHFKINYELPTTIIEQAAQSGRDINVVMVGAKGQLKNKSDNGSYHEKITQRLEKGSVYKGSKILMEQAVRYKTTKARLEKEINSPSEKTNNIKTVIFYPGRIIAKNKRSTILPRLFDKKFTENEIHELTSAEYIADCITASLELLNKENYHESVNSFCITGGIRVTSNDIKRMIFNAAPLDAVNYGLKLDPDSTESILKPQGKKAQSFRKIDESKFLSTLCDYEIAPPKKPSNSYLGDFVKWHVDNKFKKDSKKQLSARTL